MGEDKFLLPLSSLYTRNTFGDVCHPDSPSGGGGPGKFVQAGVLGTEGFFSELLPHPLSPAAKFLTPQQITQAVKGASIDITKIPKIMDANSWPKGAALMRSWFGRTSHKAPDYDTPDTTMISMKWALDFPRAKEVYDTLINERIWQNAPAQKAIAKMLASKKLLKKNVSYISPFGDFTRPVAELHADQINFRTMTSMSWFNLDDLDAALGRFTFYVLIKGTVQSNDTSGYLVSIRAVGIYIKDSYDFEGDQALGYWDPEDNSASTLNALSGTKVTNDHFQKWRKTNGMGGDFLVFSDIKEVPLSTPDTFIIKQ